MTTPTALVQKLWNYCSILRDDGLSYGDYVEQLTLLIFLKVEDKRARASLGSQNQRRDAAATFGKLAVP
jgi:type I restriction-modification system DNA methylase subunit